MFASYKQYILNVPLCCLPFFLPFNSLLLLDGFNILSLFVAMHVSQAECNIVGNCHNYEKNVHLYI